MINDPETKVLAEKMHEAMTAAALNQPQARVAAALIRVCAAVLPECACGGYQSEALRFAADILYAVADQRHQRVRQ
jgi:hypothetical protein